MAAYSLFLFGAPRLERGGAAVKISRRKALALLAYLAATGKTHARDSLATLFWPDYSQSEARGALSRHLSDLNRVLAAGVLVLEGERVALGGKLWVDVAEFAAIVDATVSATATPAPANLPALQAAVDLYAADFLAGFTLPDCPDFDDWQAFQAESLRRRLRAVLEKLVWTHAVAREYERAIAAAHRWLALDPLDEGAHRALMQLYAQAGQQAAALRQYERCAEILNKEMGVAPDGTTRQLVEAIRLGQYSPAQPGQPAHSVPASTVAPLQSTAPRHNLPTQAT